MERREYQRIKINAASQFYSKKSEQFTVEFAGTIEDISESGIRIVVDDPMYFDVMNGLEQGTEIVFQAVDSYSYSYTDRVDVFEGRVAVVHIGIRNGAYILGCRITVSNGNLQEYIKNRKVSLFLKSNK